MADKLYFCFLLEWAEVFSLLTFEQSGKLIKAMITYEKDGIEPDFSDDNILRFAWLSNIKCKLDKLKEHYDDKRRQASEAGKASAEKRRQNKQALIKDNELKQNERALTDVKSVQQKEHPSTDSTNIDIDLDIDLDKKEEIVEEEKAPQKYQPILEAWNGLPLTRITAIRGKRLDALRAREKEYSLSEIIKAIHEISDCPFLLGQNKNNWQITFDWFIKPNNFPKVLEGNYKEVKAGGASTEYGTVI